MKKLISSLCVLAVIVFAFTQTVKAGNFDSFLSTATSPRWYVIKSAEAPKAGMAIIANGMGKTLNFASYTSSSAQMFRFEAIEGQADSFKIVNKLYPNGALLNDGPYSSGGRMYNLPEFGNPNWAISILADQGNGVQYLFKAARPEGEEGPVWAELHAQTAGSLLVSWMSSSEGEEYGSRSAWFIEPAIKETSGFSTLLGELGTLIGDSESKIGNKVGDYPEDKFNELYALYISASDEESNIDSMGDEQFFALVDDITNKMNDFKTSRIKLATQFPVTSTEASPIWYAVSGRESRFVCKGGESTDHLFSKPFEAGNNKQLWRVEKEGEFYAIVNREGGYIGPKSGSGNSARYYVQEEANYNFTFKAPDEYNPAGNPKLLNVVTKAGSYFHQSNNGYGYAIIEYNIAGDPGSQFIFTDASELISKDLDYSTEAAPVWYRIKSKRETTKVSPRPYWTAFGGVDSILTNTLGEETGRTQIFGRNESMVIASGDSALWRIEKVTYQRLKKDDSGEMESAEGTLIINKLTGKILNAYKHGQSKTLRLIDRNAAPSDTIFPYWNVIDRTRNVRELQSLQRVAVDGVADDVITYANMGGKTEVVTYSVSGDGGNEVYFETIEELSPSSTPSRPEVNSIRVAVENGKIIVVGTTERASVFNITGARVDANKQLPIGVYVVKVANKTVKVTVTK